MAGAALRSFTISFTTSVSASLPSLGPGIVGSISTNEADIDWHLPCHSWDTYVHIFDPQNYPYAESRAYTPETATYNWLLKFNANLTATHVPQNLVLVQPSPYGEDNSAILDLLRSLATKDPKLDRKLRAIAGVRGFRVNTEASNQGSGVETVKKRIQDSADRVKTYPDWKCQLFISGDDWDKLYETLRNLPLKIIADHQGGMKGFSALPANSTITTQPGYKSLLALAKSGQAYIKISGLYRSSKLTAGGYDDMKLLTEELVREVPNQLIWAFDWPHTGSGANRTEETKYVPEKFGVVDDVAILKNVSEWAGPEVWWKMMVGTPSKVYE